MWYQGCYRKLTFNSHTGKWVAGEWIKPPGALCPTEAEAMDAARDIAIGETVSLKVELAGLHLYYECRHCKRLGQESRGRIVLHSYPEIEASVREKAAAHCGHHRRKESDMSKTLLPAAQFARRLRELIDAKETTAYRLSIDSGVLRQTLSDRH